MKVAALYINHIKKKKEKISRKKMQKNIYLPQFFTMLLQ